MIAIMLSQYRMTVEDCIDEYKKMGSAVFGKPRRLHAANWPLTDRTKFSTKRLEGAFEDVIHRRMVATADRRVPARFQTDTRTCRGFVLSMKVTDGTSETILPIRSYDAPSDGVPDAADTWTVLDAARAATAAPFYFSSGIWRGSRRDNRKSDTHPRHAEEGILPTGPTER